MNNQNNSFKEKVTTKITEKKCFSTKKDERDYIYLEIFLFFSFGLFSQIVIVGALLDKHFPIESEAVTIIDFILLICDSIFWVILKKVFKVPNFIKLWYYTIVLIIAIIIQFN